ncbi:Predicted ABC-type ATPase [Arachidicoccus rhizosphaerae]|uniref:Predicted ABC-type ATPase n=1 Tax=Arachidicoccus rhizosphaerae TaxID=551991 RepID=A0A1H3X515_9BACT|nr:zeta toxin family protein [Arachidicoccus rhizosphaerae]SDZ93744.1 Predicted ABC-type ATPase [Arachidicoccus rhizosphaerae]
MCPNLYVIAGPNGAGKSLFSATLVDTDFEVFDGDKYISRLQHQFPEIGSDILSNRVNEIDFQEAKDTAIQAKGNFAFETNFSSEDPTYSVRQFQTAGYKAHLIFMGISTIEECVQRVSIRVKLGGHKVAEESIKYNFEHGYKNLHSFYKSFDSITLFDNSITTGSSESFPQKIVFIENGAIELYSSILPQWVEKFIRAVKND